MPTTKRKRKTINTLQEPRKRSRRAGNSSKNNQNTESTTACKKQKEKTGERNKDNGYKKSRNSDPGNKQESLFNSTTGPYEPEEKSLTNKNTLADEFKDAKNIEFPKDIDSYDSMQIEVWINNFNDNFDKSLNFSWNLGSKNEAEVCVDQLTSFFFVHGKKNTNPNFQFNNKCIILECLIPELVPLIFLLNTNPKKYIDWSSNVETFRIDCNDLANRMNKWVSEFKIKLKSAFDENFKNEYGKHKTNTKTELSSFVCKLSYFLRNELIDFRNILLDFLELFIDDKELVEVYTRLIFLVNLEFTSREKHKDDAYVCLLFIFFIVNNRNVLQYLSSTIGDRINDFCIETELEIKHSNINFLDFFKNKHVLRKFMDEIDLFMEYMNLRNELNKQFIKYYKNQDELSSGSDYIYSEKIIYDNGEIKFLKRMSFLQFYKTIFSRFMQELSELVNNGETSDKDDRVETMIEGDQKLEV